MRSPTLLTNPITEVPFSRVHIELQALALACPFAYPLKRLGD